MVNRSEIKEKENIVYTKDALIREIARQTGRKVDTVRDVYNTLECIVEKHLSSANAKTDVSVRLFKGVAIDSQYIPEETQINNLTGKLNTSMSKIRPKAVITRYYREKLTENSKNNQNNKK